MRKAAGLALLFILAAALAALALRDGIAPHDEGLMLAGGRRVASGELPYRDFWTNYGPAQFYVLAGLHKLFGDSLLAWRILLVAIDGAIAVLAYAIVREKADRPFALLAWAAAAGAVAWPALPGPTPPALLCALAALRLSQRRDDAGAGALAGLAAVFRPEIGLAALLGIRRGIVSWAFVVLAGWLPFVIAAPGDWARDVPGFVSIQGLQRLPFPLRYDGGADPNKLFEFFLPAILVTGFALAAAASARRRELDAAAPLALAGLLYLLARPDEFHLIVLATALAVVLALRAAREPVVGRVVLGAGLVLIALHGLDRQLGRVRHPGALAKVPGQDVRTTPKDARALRVLIRRLPRGPIFVAPPRMDRVSVGAPILYTILHRDNPTRYDVMQPGLVTTARVQREIVRELHGAVVVRWLDPRARRVEDDGAGRERGSRIFDRYVAARYRRAFRTGDYAVYVARR